MPESEDRWRAALECSGLGVWDWNVADHRIYYSTIWKAMRGLGPDEDGPDVADWDDWLHPDDRDGCAAALQEHLAGKTPLYEREQRVRCKTGGYRWVLARGQVHSRDADGRPLRIIGTNLDIDDAKRAGLRSERHGRLYAAIAACNVAISRRRSRSELLHEVCRILVDIGAIKMAWVGCPNADGTRIVPVASFCHDADAGNLQGMYLSLDPAQPTSRGPSVLAFHINEPVWLDDSATDPSTEPWHARAVRFGLHATGAIPIRQRGRPTATLTICIDEPGGFDESSRTLLQDMAAQLGLALDTLDAERTAAEFQDSLRRSEQRTEAMFERAPLGIALKDSVTGRYLDVNPKFQEMVGRSRETLLDLRWQDITHPEDRRRIEAAPVYLTDETPVGQIEKRYVRADGGVISVVMTIAKFEHPEGCNPRHLAMVEDVTERMELQQQLSQRQRLEALGQLTGGIAHDFNNLLTVIIGNSEALAQELGEGDLGELAGLILTTGERAADLTGRLLTFARKQSLAPRSLGIGELIDGLLPLLRRAVPERIQLKLSARFSPCWVYADPTQLEMALFNLVLNARDAMPASGTIEISSETVEVGQDSPQDGELQAGRYVAISVSDDGTGMSANTLEQAFDPFFTTKAPGHGSGLGLSMVYGFARQSGGSVVLASRLGEGTTVRLYLPATAGLPAEAPRGIDQADNRGAGETVLVAEDDAMVRKYVVAQVTGLGYRTIAAADGQSALDVLRGHTPVDLLFTDIAMEGGMDGIELAGQARAIRPDLRVLFTSGHAEQHLERLAEIDAMLLRKPYRRKDLAARLRDALVDGG